MAINLLDPIKDNKKVFLSMGGIILLAILIVFVNGKGGVFEVSDSIVDGNVATDGGNGSTNGGTTNQTPAKKTYSSAPTMQLKKDVDYQARITTNYGVIVIDLFEEDTPVTVNNFVFLANEGFYNNLTFHRIVKDFVIQGGDPLGPGIGGPGYSFKDEIDATALELDNITVSDATFLVNFYTPTQLQKNKDLSVREFYEEIDGFVYTTGYGKTAFGEYVVAMANSGPATNGSQFFITLQNSELSQLNGKHTIFGKVIDGFNNVDTIGNLSTNSSGKPTKDVKITSIQVLEK